MTTPSQTTLHLLCGKVASGKSTLAGQLASPPCTLLLSEDAWLSGLYSGELRTLADYVRYSARLRQTIAPHVIELLRNGTSVVLDFQANTRNSRLWMRRLVNEAQCHHQLHYLDAPDEICKARLLLRNAEGTHDFNVTEAQFDKVTAHFEPPSADEGFNLTRYETIP
ncbi:ATP-binding protein [Roseibium sp. AS2]|uniref:AAA family ATPase n=1 Tax=Roseibium sp. AS2 TaxID=3135781 RepID=UPI003173CD1E